MRPLMELHMATQATVTKYYNSMMKMQVKIKLHIATGNQVGPAPVLLETPQICMILLLFNLTGIIFNIIILVVVVDTEQ